MAGSGVIHGKQDVARMDREGLAAQGGKFENTSQSKDVLRDGVVVPVEG